MTDLDEPTKNLPNRNERRRQKTKEIVRTAAIETFLKQGYLNATVQDIMERADLGYGTFYQYYKGKPDVIVELASEAQEIIKNDVCFSAEEETNLVKRIISRLEKVFDTYGKHRNVLKILLECHHSDEDLNRAWHQLMELPNKALKKDLAWGMEQGICRDVDINTAIIALNGMIQAIGVHVVTSNLSVQEIKEIARDVGLVFTHALYTKEEFPLEVWRKKD